MEQPRALNATITINPLWIDDFTPKSPEQIFQDNIPACKALEDSSGRSFLIEAERLFKSKGITSATAINNFKQNLDDLLAYFRELAFIDLTTIEDLPINERKSLFKEIFEKACTKTYLEESRKELSTWAKKIEKGKALFVDCPMGVGKTFSIAKVLGLNPNISAIIFMPTIKLCKRLVQALKKEILKNDPSLRDKYHGVRVDEEAGPDDEDEYTSRLPISFVYTREFLEYYRSYEDAERALRAGSYDRF